ncbi:MAG: DUF3347 domain-containing protein [Cyclobacteriaceae bacterium]
MKSIIAKFNLGLFLLAMVWMSACSQQQENQTENTIEPIENVENNTSTQQVGGVVDGYLKLKDALVDSNAEEAKQYAVAMLEVVDAGAAPEVQQAVKEIAGTSDLEAQRKSFETLSTALYDKLKENQEVEQTLYKQYCPMAFDDKGAFWLSAQEEIRNPYFGDRMLKCGSVQETLAAN